MMVRLRVNKSISLDPHTSAELSIEDIYALCDDMIEAHGKWLPAFK